MAHVICSLQATSAPLVDINKTECTSQDYSGSVCLPELQEWHYCGGGSGPVPISSEVEQETQERETQQILTGLQFLNPSTECVRAFRPFFCLFSFGICDGSGNVVQPSYQDCVALRTDICAKEIQSAIALLDSDPFPPCETFPHNMTLCCKYDNINVYIFTLDVIVTQSYTPFCKPITHYC